MQAAESIMYKQEAKHNMEIRFFDLNFSLFDIN